MAKSTSKVVYKPDSQSTEEYIVIVNTEEFKKWKDGDTTIPLTEVVDSFTVFYSNQGPQGLLGQPSKQQLDTIFGTSKDIDVVTTVLQKGRQQASDGIASTTYSTNASRGSAGSESRGKGSSV